MDGSRVTTRNRITLNKSLMAGFPDYSLVRSLTFWRLNNYGGSTDIGKFFNKICLFPKDRQYLSMLFSEEFGMDDVPEWFVLLTHSFGYISSSAVAKEAVMKISETSSIDELHEVVETLKLGYVDDLNPSTDTMEEMMQLKQDLTRVMTNHSMCLKGWAVSGTNPDPALSNKSFTMVGGWMWHSLEDEIQLRTPDIYLGKKKKGTYSKNTKILHQNPTEDDIINFYKNEPINIEHIVSRISSLFDMTGQASPLCVLGHYVARLALTDTKGNKTTPISVPTRKLFIKFLFLTSKFGNIKFRRNPGIADSSKDSIILAFADSSQIAWMCVILLLRTSKDNKFYTQFVYANGGLNPPGRTIPRNELNGYARTAQITDSISDILEKVATKKKLLGDNQISLFWVINRAKKSSIFVQNRVAKIASTFSDGDLLHIKTKDNIADYGTRPTSTPLHFEKLLPGGSFRTGPAFLTKGIERAIADGDVTQMNKLAQSIQEQELENLMDLPYNTKETSDPMTLDLDEQKNDAIDTVLLLNFSNTTFLENVERCTDFSQYIIHPLKLPYTKFHLALTVCFKFLSDITITVHSEIATKARAKILQETNEEIYAPTVVHLVPRQTEEETQDFTTSFNETNKLDHYKPYNTQDNTSRQQLAQWINYPGLLKITRMARRLHKQAELQKEQKNIQEMVHLAEILKTNTRILASSQVGPITTSMSIAAMKKASNTTPQIAPILLNLINGEGKQAGILTKTKSLVTSPTSWPQRKKATINQIFTTNDIRKFSKVTENYLNRKASLEVNQFLSPRVLARIAIKHEGLWLARNRTLLANNTMNPGLINPVLRYNQSPLTIALVKHNHTRNDKMEPARPSSCFHNGPKQDQTKFLKYGVIYMGAPLFREV